MKLILAVDAIHPPLTGIGRYAVELLRGLRQRTDIESLRYFSLGRWVDDPLAALDAPASTPIRPPRPTLRSRLAGNRLAVQLYGQLSPLLYRWRLRGNADALFHSPNFLLPPFAGRSVATIHDLSCLLYPQFHPAARVELMQRLLPQSLRQADHLIVPAESVKRETIEHFGWPAERITAIAHGADPRFRPHTVAELAPLMHAQQLSAGRYTLCVGTIEPRKNLDRLLDAYAALPFALRQHYPLVLAGSRGWNSDTLHQRIASHQAAGWLHYLEYVPEAQLPALYAGAALFVYPSLYEGFGLPILEAMACGVPVITSKVSSMPEVAGDAGRLIDPLDTDALRAALQQALEDPTWRQQAGAASLAQAKRFSWSRAVDETVAVYRRVLESGSDNQPLFKA